MRQVKWIEKIITFVLIMIMCIGTGTSVMAAESDNLLSGGMRSLGLSEGQIAELNNKIQPRESAPGLSSLAITDLTVDEKNEIHIEVKIMGTAKSVLCWCDGMQCTENYKESVSIVSGNRVIGEYRYFHTGIYYSDSVSGQTLHAQAQALNAMQPWNTLSTTRYFTIP